MELHRDKLIHFSGVKTGADAEVSELMHSFQSTSNKLQGYCKQKQASEIPFIIVSGDRK